jgi:hypothetical protein
MAMPASLVAMATRYSEGDENGLEYGYIPMSEDMYVLVVDWGRNGEWIGEYLGLWAENFRRPRRVAWAVEICVSQGAKSWTH